jgi:hypothetical protein
MNLGTKLARLLLVALAIAGAAAGLARADLASGTPQLQFLGQFIIPTGTQFEGTEVGGLSGIAYDARHRVYYALSDDPSQIDPARFYTLRIETAGGAPTVHVLDVTTLTDRSGQPFPPQSLDPEGIALTTRRTLVITSEGFANRLVDPWVREFSLSGRQLRDLPVPDAFRPNAAGTRGVRLNLGFESASATPDGRFVFTGTEAALVQDGPPATLAAGSPARLLRYDTWVGWLDRQYVYWTDPVARAPVPPTAFAVSGLVELLPLDTQSLLSMERSFSVGVPGTGNTIKLFTVSVAEATNVNGVGSIAPLLGTLTPASKTLLLSLDVLGIPLDNVEGMDFGQTLPDGRQSLVLVSDNNFAPAQFTQFLLFAVS